MLTEVPGFVLCDEIVKRVYHVGQKPIVLGVNSAGQNAIVSQEVSIVDI